MTGKGPDNLNKVLENLPDAFAYHRALYDQTGRPIDYLFLEVNPAFENMTGLQKNDLIGRKVSEILPVLKEADFDWIGTYGRLASEGGSIRFESYSEPLERWYEVTAFSYEPEYFATIFRDVTVSRRKEESFLFKEKRFSRAQLFAGMGTWEYHLADCSLTWSPECARLFGIEPAEFGGTFEDFLAYIHPADREYVLQINQPAVQGKEGLELRYEHRIIRKDGTVRWVREEAGPVMDEEGKIITIIGMVSDITERKEVEDKVRQLVEEQLLLLDNIESQLWYLKDVQTYGVVNQAHADFFNLKKEDLSNKTLREIMQSEEEVLVCVEGNKSVFEEKRPIKTEEWVKNGRGELRLLSITKNPKLDEEGKALYVVCSALDITEQREAERELWAKNEQLRGILESQQDLIVRVDLKGHFLYVNDAYCKKFGRTCEQLIGSSFSPLVHPDDLQTTLEAMEGLYLPPYRAYMEQRAMTVDGWRWIAWEDSAIMDKSGNVIEIQGVGRDITAKREAEEGLKKIQADLENKVRERTGDLEKINLELQREINERRRIEIALQQKLGIEKVIADISALFINISPKNLDEAVNYLLKRTGEYLAVERSYIFLLSEDQTHLVNSHEWCAPGIEAYREQLQHVSVEILPWWMEKLSRLEYINISTLADLPPQAAMEKSLLEFQNVSAVLVVPLIYSNKLIGYVGFNTVAKPLKWSEEQIEMLKVIAGIFGNVLVRIRYEQSLAAEKELLKTTMRSINEGLIVIDPDRRILLINDRALELTGWSGVAAQGEYFYRAFNILEPESAEVADNPLAVIKKRMLSYGYTAPLTLVSRKGEKFSISASAVEIRDDQSDDMGHVIVFQDITEKKKIEAQLALSQKLRSLGQMAAGIAHEINTPLQFIGDNLHYLRNAHSNTENLKEHFFNILVRSEKEQETDLIAEFKDFYRESKIESYLKEVSVAISEALEGIDRVNLIISAMKDYSHSTAGEKKPANLNRTILNTVTLSRSEWKNIALVDLELDENLPSVNCEVSALSQVFLNIIINAVHAIEEAVGLGYYRKGKIVISSSRQGRQVVITFVNNGVPIPGEQIPRIFDPFFTTKEVGQGSGQGLAIAYDIITNRHGGTIEVVSSETANTTFTITLPLQPEQQKAE
jgi:PAS domain S-box-containing protein